MRGSYSEQRLPRRCPTFIQLEQHHNAIHLLELGTPQIGVLDAADGGESTNGGRRHLIVPCFWRLSTPDVPRWRHEVSMMRRRCANICGLAELRDSRRRSVGRAQANRAGTMHRETAIAWCCAVLAALLDSLLTSDWASAAEADCAVKRANRLLSSPALAT